MASGAADIFGQAAELNRNDSRRRGNVVELTEPGEMIVCGDIHGNRAALTKILAHAALERHPERTLVLQEIAHGPVDPRTGHDRSAEVLLRAARLKMQHPEQVLFLLANHDVAQITGNEITKAGRRVCEDFNQGVRGAFEDAADEVLAAISVFLGSCPLAVRCPNGVFLCHTLPSPRRMDLAGTEIFQRDIQEQDLHRGGAVYEWTWGRGQTPEQIDQLADALGAAFFVLGHKHIDAGYEFLSARAMVVASDHDHGGLLQFRTDQPLDDQTALMSFKPVAALGR